MIAAPVREKGRRDRSGFVPAMKPAPKFALLCPPPTPRLPPINSAPARPSRSLNCAKAISISRLMGGNFVSSAALKDQFLLAEREQSARRNKEERVLAPGE